MIRAAALLGFGGHRAVVRLWLQWRDERCVLPVANATFTCCSTGVGVSPYLARHRGAAHRYANLYPAWPSGALALALFLVVAKTEKGAR
ncbi:MAG: hypothetical protein ACLTDR_15860 [Adlercreutzia equolifaciens]